MPKGTGRSLLTTILTAAISALLGGGVGGGSSLTWVRADLYRESARLDARIDAVQRTLEARGAREEAFIASHARVAAMLELLSDDVAAWRASTLDATRRAERVRRHLEQGTRR